MPSNAPKISSDEAISIVDSLLAAGEFNRPVALPAGFAERCSPEQALELQATHQKRLIERIGGRAIGIKLGGTTTTALSALGLDSPFTGPLLSARHHASPARVARNDFNVCVIEAEIAVRLGRDIAPRTSVPSPEELLDAIDAMYPSIEIADSRLVNWAKASAREIVTDLGYAGAWVQGEACEAWRTLDPAAIAVSLSCDGEVVRNGSGSLVLGNPLHALGLAVAALGRRGLGLKAGTLVSTGSCTPPWPIPGGGHIVADFGTLGQVTLELKNG